MANDEPLTPPDVINKTVEGQIKVNNSVDAERENEMSSAEDGNRVSYDNAEPGVQPPVDVYKNADNDWQNSEKAGEESKAASKVATPYGDALQALTKETLAARGQVQGGATLYRIGTTGKSAASEAQFWSLENPLSPGYAARYGLPAENIANANFIETATLKPGASFVTRPAPGLGSNPGGGIEVVVPSGGVNMQTFTTIP